MQRVIHKGFIYLLLLLSLSLTNTGLAATKNSQFLKILTKARAEKDRLLFVISAGSSEISSIPTNPFQAKKYRVILKDVTPHATYFNQPPNQIVGVVKIQDLTDSWPLLSDAIPGFDPNIALESTDKIGRLSMVDVLSISNPKYNAADRTFSFTGKQRTTDSTDQIRTGTHGPTTVFLG